jgi:hypothetical protein
MLHLAIEGCSADDQLASQEGTRLLTDTGTLSNMINAVEASLRGSGLQLAP